MFAAPRQQRQIQWGIILIVMLIAGGIRLARLPLVTMWSDEYHSFKISSLPLSEIIQGNYGRDYNPPLYFALLHLQRRIFGDSEIAMRSPSLVFALITLPLFFFSARSILKAFIPSTAALVLMAFHPMLIYYSIEIRSYSLLVLFSVLSFLSCVMIHNGAKRQAVWLILLTLGLLGCLYTHYFGIIVPLSIIVFIGTKSLYFKRWSKSETLSLLGIGVAALLYLPGILILRRQALTVPTGAVLTPLIQSLQVFVASIAHPPYEQGLVYLAILAFVSGLIVLFTQIRSTPAGLLVICGIATAVTFTLIASLNRIDIANRYLIPALPLVIIAIGATLTRRSGAWYRLINIVGVITIAVYILYGTTFVLNTSRENQQASWKADWKQFSEVVRKLRIDDEPLVVMGWDATPIQYYLGDASLSSFELESQLPLRLHPSYLIIMTPNSRTIPILDSATLLYEDKSEGLRILRLRVQSE